MIDAHYYAYTPAFEIYGNDHMQTALMVSQAAKIFEDSLKRGITIVRDLAEGDIGLWLALEQSLIKRPRFFCADQPFS